jgi:hypothetical protein
MHLVSSLSLCQASQPKSSRLNHSSRTVGITPMIYGSLDPAQAHKVCIDDTVTGLQSMVNSSPTKPFRFLYMSGADAETDQTKTPTVMPEYFLMRVSF